jgi:SAM-dependent methyltransferase
MDKSSMDLMRQLIEKYDIRGKVLDVGSLDVNGTYRELFSDYTGSDVVKGANVDVLQPSQYVIPFPDRDFDHVISGQMLEHCDNPFKVVAEMVRVLKKGGTLTVVVPWKMDYHPYPVDCWRFSPDAFVRLTADLPLQELENAFAAIYNPYEIGTCYVGRRI